MRAVTFTTRGPLNKSALRHANERLVLNVLRRNPAVSRADIVRITGLSPTSVTFIVRRLSRQKLIVEEKTDGYSQVGRQPTALRLRPASKVALGVEITLEGARLIAADLNDAVIARKSVPWHSNYELFFDKVHGVLRSLIEPFAKEHILGVGVALPGFIDKASGKVIAAENLNWFGVEAGRLIRRRLPLPFYYENAAKLSALAEMWSSDRDPKPLRDFVTVTANGGLGTGVIVNGQILQGAAHAGGEFGHMVLYPDGRKCRCGNTGCWEQYASDLALCRMYSETCVQAGKPCGKVDAGAIVRKARQADPAAAAVVQEAARHLGLGFASLVMALNPEVVILGGYLAEAWDLMESTIWGVLRSRVPAYYLTAFRVVVSRHGADSALVGAAAVVLNGFFNSFEQTDRTAPTSSVSIRASA
jgi:predicted NBD/HSP70 family sugar kinase